jgi:hypothetical protein
VVAAEGHRRVGPTMSALPVRGRIAFQERVASPVKRLREKR